MIQVVFISFLWITCATADILQCEITIGFKIPNSCGVSGGVVSSGENLNISNADPKVITFLTFQNTNFTTMPQNIFINFPLVKLFYVSRNTLNKLAINDFKNGLKLSDVFFYETQIQVIPPNIFRLGPNIEKLTFANCPIQRIAKGAFSNSKKVKELALTDLPLAMYPSNMLANMTALEQLKMENCSLKTLPEDFFRNNQNLTKINFDKNQLESIPERMLDNLDNLAEIHLDSNNLLTLSTSKAQQVYAQNNQIQQLHISSTTKVVYMQNNFISKVTCNESSNVTLAYFSNNSLLNFECFRDMKNALHIYADNNKISKLNAKAFNNLQAIKVLYINGNPNLKATSKMFTPLTSLREIAVDRLTTGYKNIRQQHPELSMLYLTTRSWNCSYLKQVANTLNTQRIYLRFINQYEDFVNFKCQLKMWDVSKFD